MLKHLLISEFSARPSPPGGGGQFYNKVKNTPKFFAPTARILANMKVLRCFTLLHHQLGHLRAKTSSNTSTLQENTGSDRKFGTLFRSTQFRLENAHAMLFRTIIVLTHHITLFCYYRVPHHKKQMIILNKIS